MDLELPELTSYFHEHKLVPTDRNAIFDICSKYLIKEQHFFCEDCCFDICYECLEEKTSSSHSIKRIQESIKNTQESQAMMEFIKERIDIQFTTPALEGSLVRSYPTFCLYEEHDKNENFLLEATRNYIDEKGQIIYFISSSKARKLIPICKRSCDDYFDMHSSRLKASQHYPKLRVLKDPESDFARTESYIREGASSFAFGATFGIAFGVEHFFFTPIMEKSYAGYYLLNALMFAVQNHVGVSLILTDDFHITPFFNDSKSIKTENDHNISIDWSTIESIPIIISLTNEIKKLYQNILNEGNQHMLNILFSIADDLQEGLSLMKQNPLFSKQDEKRLITFADSSIKSLQIFMRLKSNPITVLNTTVLNVYQADLVRELHAFLSSDQLQGILNHLVTDIRENLTSMSQYGEVINLDLKDPKPVFVILNSYITDAEVRLAKFIQEATDKIKNYCTKIKNQFASLTMSHFDSISQYIFGDKENQVNNLKAISDFNQSHQKELENILTQSIQKKIIPDYYSIELAKMQNEIAQLKHLVKLVRLACEIERRINDNIGIFNIDLSIIQNKESIYEYKIHIII